MRIPTVSRMLFAVLAGGLMGGLLAWSPFAQTAIPVYVTNPACTDPPCTSPDAGADWACPELPQATLRVSAGSTANLWYRTTPDPDGGVVATTSDIPVWATEIEAGRQLGLASNLGDAGCLVLVHLSAPDPSAGVAHCP